MNNNAAGSPVWRPRRSVTGATLSWRASLACMSIRSAVAARNSMPTCRADPLTVSGATRSKKNDPEMIDALKQLAAPVTGGDPMTEAKYVRCSLQHLSDGLAELGHTACPHTVADLLRDLDYRLRVNVKRLTGPYHRDRDTQFRYLRSVVDIFRAEGWPILSVDTKKKELVGNFANTGAPWVAEPYEVNAHDFLSDALYRAA